MRKFVNGSRHLREGEIECIIVQKAPEETWGDRIKREYLNDGWI